ncbi:MAG: MarR family transcriptional regulator [Gammaproteobacteria bacterium]
MSTRRDALLTINSAMTQLMRRIRRVDEAQGAGRARLSALAVLHFGGSCSLSDLAATEMVSRATMHHVVNGLEDDGLVRRSMDPEDARRQIITLTRKGTGVITRAHRARIDYLRSVALDVSAEELAIAASVLDRLRGAAAELADRAGS